jgi:acetyl-CoA synthetase
MPSHTTPLADWVPTNERIERANVTALMRQLELRDVRALLRWSNEHLEDFLRVTVERLGVKFHKPPTRMMDLSPGGVKNPRWFAGAEMNIVESCWGGAPDAPALVTSVPGGKLERWTYAQLRAMTNRVSNSLVRAGFQRGDAIAVLMPMTMESVAIYLGIVQAGCVVIGIADSFAPAEIATRLKIANTKGVICVDTFVRGGKTMPMYEKVRLADGPRAIVTSDSAGLRRGDVRWSEFLAADDVFDAVACSPDDTINILFSSGTTGEPKAIPFDHTCAVKCALDGHWLHDLHAGDVVAWPTSLGWMMGPWLIFAALMNRGTVALHHDVAHDRGFGQFVQDARVNMLGVVPSLVRRWRETRCMEGLDWSRVDAFSSTGECSNADDMRYLMNLAGGKPVIEYCGGTEIGGGFLSSTVVQPNVAAAFSTPALGGDVVILDDAGKPLEQGEGELFVVPPSIGLSRRLLNRSHDEVYFKDCPALPDGRTLRRHGDQFARLPGGYWRALGRADDTMNLGGIKVSSAEIERALLGVPGVKDTAAIAVNPPGGGPSLLVIYAVILPRIEIAQLQTSMQKSIRTNLNPLFKIHEVVPIDALPRTASQKVMRRELRAKYEAEHRR